MSDFGFSMSFYFTIEDLDLLENIFFTFLDNFNFRTTLFNNTCSKLDVLSSPD